MPLEYFSYWNLREKPFQNVPETRFAYMAEQHREALARLLYLVDGRKLGGVLTGTYGVGKTMVIELLAQAIAARPNARCVVIESPAPATLPLARQLISRLGSDRDIHDLGEALDTFQALCLDSHAPFDPLVLVVDEAQVLRDPAVFEFFHLLTNFRSPRKGASDDAAFTLILAGHSDLRKRVEADESLSQRLTLFWELEPLTEAQVIEYVHHRMRVAGGDIWTFDEEALQEVFRGSRGLPRLINNICDIALLAGRASQAPSITADLVRQATAEAQGTPLAPAEKPKGDPDHE